MTAEGGSGSVALNLNNGLGAVGEFALHHAAVVGPVLARGTYTFGPPQMGRDYYQSYDLQEWMLTGIPRDPCKASG
ncbi:MAG TPA: hypothetical protein VF740_07710 [Candidatus Acidoferrum sp.]